MKILTISIAVIIIACISCRKPHEESTFLPFIQLDIYGSPKGSTSSLSYSAQNKNAFIAFEDTLGHTGVQLNSNSNLKSTELLKLSLDTTHHFTLNFYVNGKFYSQRTLFLKMSSPNKFDVTSYPHKIDSMSIEGFPLKVDTAVLVYHSSDRNYNPVLVESSIQQGYIYMKYNYK